MKIDLVIDGYIFHEDKVLLLHHRDLDMWLPSGGHIDPDETPDMAVVREAKEETNLDVEILNKSTLPMDGNVKENLAVPYYSNVHNVGDHDHCCLFYACVVKNIDNFKINDESYDYHWFKIDELDDKRIDASVKNQILAGYEVYKRFK